MSNKLASKSKQNKKKQNMDGASTAKLLLEYVLAVLGIALSVLIPLYLKDSYYSVGEVKFALYQGIMLIGAALLLILAVIYWTLKDDKIKEQASVTDWCLVAFLIFSIIAAICGGNFEACMRGYRGWYMGILSLFSFGLLYYFFSRFGRYYKGVLVCLCLVSAITYVFGILHRLMIDIIGTYDGIADTYKNQFLSTLGQATWYSSFVCTVLPLGIALFWCGKEKWQRIFSGIFSFLGFCTLITQGSDSAYVALAGFIAVFFWFSASAILKLQRWMEILVLFIGATRFMYLAFGIHPNPILDLDTLSNFLIFHPAMWGAFAVSIMLWGLCFLGNKKEIRIEKIGRICRNVIFVIVGLLIFSVVIILILGAKGVLPAGMAALTEKIPYLKWSESWGNNRGKTWEFTVQMFGDMSALNKLFGVGPDGYAPYAYAFYQERLVEMWGDRTLVNAHNEWLNALVSYGIVGTVAYVGIFITSIKEFAKKQIDKPMMVGFIACVVSYMCHNFFCYQQVCCTPFLFIIIGAGMYMVRE